MLEGKIALVTGAAKGIGRAIALALAADGATVVVNYNGSKERAEQVVEEIKALGADGVAYQCNVADTAATADMVKEVIKTYGKLDILVNNAGITRDNLIMKMSEEDFDAVIDANLKGCFNTIKAVSRQMLKQRAGRIINITSVSGILGNAGQANYAASKAGIIGLTKTMARELASRGITVNAVAPGFVDTDMTQVLPENVKEAATAQIPLGRFGKPEDIANMVAYLASEKASYITGQIISVDGGMAI
ncbi:beta-ketoacyl-ACP reductase [Lachnoclostridium sp. An196]|uniref:3-oxoacyl-[acyl-carrier-protein] reductase n=1 Tax=Lachnoclostridium sp. An196 TaxID=1965583 RepID=UPI000B380D66|nr:3-oxoacyl-[acyl-carrier-protein] reductase [Lachnoclostridium sp. An196]OUP21480.1 beta-ketoacyl-ACP reductase [Lachnoclostridium sp. An196]